MLMSHAAISCAVAVRPRPGPAVVTVDGSPSVVAQDAVIAATMSPAAVRIQNVRGWRVESTGGASCLYENIGDAPVGGDFPSLDRMVVVARGLSIFRQPGGARRLDVTFL